MPVLGFLKENFKKIGHFDEKLKQLKIYGHLDIKNDGKSMKNFILIREIFLLASIDFVC